MRSSRKGEVTEPQPTSCKVGDVTTFDAPDAFPTLAQWHHLRSHTLPRRRRQRVVRGLLWLAVVGVLAGNVYILTQRNVTTPVTLRSLMNCAAL